MIEFIRNRLNSVFVLLLMGLLVASFAFFGIGDVVQVGRGDVVAQVGERDVTIVDLDRAFQTFVSRNQQQNPELNERTAVRAGVDVQVLQQLIRQELLIQSADDMGLTGSNERTRRAVANMEAFQLAGRFDPATYQAALARLGISEQQLFEELNNQQIIEQLQGALVASAMVPSKVTQAQIKALLETRLANAIILPISSQEANVEEPNQEALETFFAGNRAAYQAPEYRSFVAVYLTPDQVSSDIEVSEEDLSQAYEFRRDEFGSPAEIELQLVGFDTEEEAKNFAADAVNGALFLQLAEERTGATREDLEIGRLSKDSVASLYGDDVAEAVFKLDRGDVSAPLEGNFGYQVFRVADKQEESFKTFEEVREDLMEQLVADEALARLDDIGREMEDEFAGGATLEEAAKSFGLQVIEYADVSDTGVTLAGGLAPEQSLLQQILPTVFESDTDNEAELLSLDEEGYYVFRLDSVTDSRLKELEEVRADVEKAWRVAEIDRLTLNAADVIAEKVRGGASMADLAAADALEFIEDIRFNRLQARQGSLANADIAPLLFNMREGETDVARGGDGQSYVIANLKSIDEGDGAQMPALEDQLQTQLQSLVAQELQQQYIAGRFAQYPPTINQRALETLRKNYDPTL